MEQEKKGGKGLAIASLVLGILAFINSFIPVINFVAYILAILAIIFGIIGIVKRKGAMAIVGLVLGGVAFITATIINASTASFVDDALKESGADEITSITNDKESEKKFSYTVDKQYYDDYRIGYYIEGSVKNNKDKDYIYVQIEFICYDSEGNNLGTAMDNTNNLLGNQTWKYKAIFLGTTDNIDHCDYHEITGW